MPTPRSAARVLIVDDEEDTAMLLREALRRRGFSVDAVLSGADWGTRLPDRHGPFGYWPDGPI